jgi:chromosome segregation ATPase
VNNGYDPTRLDRIEAMLEQTAKSIAESQKQAAESQRQAAESQRRFDESQRLFDERIARLTERHEALSQSVEISKHDMDDLNRQTNLKFAQTAELINQLAQIVAAHERRLDDLQSGQR